jgi:hypothetical protein
MAFNRFNLVNTYYLCQGASEVKHRLELLKSPQGQFHYRVFRYDPMHHFYQLLDSLPFESFDTETAALERGEFMANAQLA